MCLNKDRVEKLVYIKSNYPILEAKKFDDWGINEDKEDSNENANISIFDSGVIEL